MFSGNFIVRAESKTDISLSLYPQQPQPGTERNAFSLDLLQRVLTSIIPSPAPGSCSSWLVSEPDPMIIITWWR